MKSYFPSASQLRNTLSLIPLYAAASLIVRFSLSLIGTSFISLAYFQNFVNVSVPPTIKIKPFSHRFIRACKIPIPLPLFPYRYCKSSQYCLSSFSCPNVNYKVLSLPLSYQSAKQSRKGALQSTSLIKCNAPFLLYWQYSPNSPIPAMLWRQNYSADFPH